MIKFFKRATQTNNIISAKQTIRIKALDVVEKMEKLNDHLEIIKNIDTNDTKEIYNKDKNILISLYDYYCKYHKLYAVISFSQILNPIDIPTIKNMDIKIIAKELKGLHKKDYETTIEFLQDEDKIFIKNIFDNLENFVDNLVNLLINIQSDIIITEKPPIENDLILERIKNLLSPNTIFDNLKQIESTYLNYMDEYNASKEIFNKD